VEYRQLGRTGVRVSALCLGTMNLGGRAQRETSAAIIEQALDAGINFIDSANVYGHAPDDFETGRGRSEEIIGETLERLGVRSRVILATKTHFPMSDDPNDQGNNRRNIIASCEASLRRLRTDYIDLYQLHHPSNDVPIDESLRALDDLVRDGKVRYIGGSAFAAWQHVEALWAARELGLHRFIAEQPPYHLLDRRIERELAPMARSYGLAINPWSPTAGGFLTGRYRRGKSIPADSRFGVFWRGAVTGQFTERAFDVAEGVAALAAEKGCTPGQLALTWCMAQPGITSPLIGPRTVDQLEESFGALDIELTPEDRERLDRLAPPGRATVPYYGHDGFARTTWGPHTQRW